MPDVPEEAVTAAAAVIRRELPAADSDVTLARAALAAAAPILAEAVAAKITDHRDRNEPKGPLIGGKPAEAQRRSAWRRHFGIAARVAAMAFSTEEEIMRAAVATVERGDAIVCGPPEVPGERCSCGCSYPLHDAEGNKQECPDREMTWRHPAERDLLAERLRPT